ncbi:uncharacterized protein LOC117645483 isoform X1 [Thrips palmi]|uniref:Uncharacterized protein LOC117645483 isoform X1 n=1 Tax=Thrips palmi TaxID=161013 RepID=A0A6P8Z4U7_THRPL|nr:uncharacterized protein LOC117645483 isoform X1 [Thrips palmi]
MEEATTLCSNCQRPIAASNYVIHSLHCQRNLMKCDKCGEAVPRSGLEEHDFEFHSKVNCPDCHMSVERPQLDTHKKTVCRSRQQGCLYCELEMPASEISHHEDYCGSRTKKCEDCGEYVMLKYEQLHIDSNHGFLKLDDEPGPTATWIKNDIKGRSTPTKSNNNSKPQLNIGKFIDDDDDVDDMHSLFANLLKKQNAVGSTTHYPGVAYPISGEPQRYVSRSPPPFQDVLDDTSDLVALPCEFCEAMIPVNQLILHQTGCRMDIASFGRPKKSQNDSTMRKNLSVVNEVDGGLSRGSLERMNEFWEDSRDKQENAGSFDMRDSRRNAVAHVGKVNVDRHRNDIGECNVDMRRNAIDEGSEASLKNELEEDGVYFLPCEFCEEGYPPSLLLEHQDVCEYNPKNISEATPVWSEPQDVPSGKSKETLETLRPRKYDENNYNTFVDSDQPNSSMEGEPKDPHFLRTPQSPPRQHEVHCQTDPIDEIVSKWFKPIQSLEFSTDFKKESCDKKLVVKAPGNTRHESSDILNKVPGTTISSSFKKPGEISLSAFYQTKPSSNTPKVAQTRASQDLFATTTKTKKEFHSGKVSSSIMLGSRGKNNISNSYNDLRGNFTVASEWSDDSDSRPTSATGAIPKQKAGKLNFSRKVNQEVQSSRPSNSIVPRRGVSRGVDSSSDNGQGYHIRNNLKDLNDDEDDD